MWVGAYVYHRVMSPTADAARMGRTTIQVSDRLADELHDRKDRGDSYEDVIWGLIEASDRGGHTEPTEPPAEPAADDGGAIGGEPRNLTTEERERVADALAGNGDLLTRRVDAIEAMFRELQREGSAEKGDLIGVVDVDATGYADANSVWSNMVKGRDTLRTLPGVEKPATGRTEWTYTGSKD